jgi:hypothetical protein
MERLYGNARSGIFYGSPCQTLSQSENGLWWQYVAFPRRRRPKGAMTTRNVIETISAASISLDKVRD